MNAPDHESEWRARVEAERALDRAKRERAITLGTLVPAELADQDRDRRRDARVEAYIRRHGLRVLALEGASPLPRPGAELPELDVWAHDPFAGAADPRWRAENPAEASPRRGRRAA